MKNEKKALILASIAALLMLCGCSKKPNTIETEDGTYIETNGEYVKLSLNPVIYEPGAHVIMYNQYIGGNQNWSTNDGWEYSRLSIPEVPEGYRYVETIDICDGGYGRTNAFIHIYVNTKTVEVTPIYNSEKDEIDYCMPGKVVEEKTLELGD